VFQPLRPAVANDEREELLAEPPREHTALLIESE
jgi:hypothetical protein